MDKELMDKINIFLVEAQKLYNIKFAYVFGSYARGQETKASDIDFAFMLQNGLNKVDEMFLRGNFIELAKEIFNIGADVIFLNADSPLLKYEVIKDGIVIKDHEDRAEFESLSLRQYFDYKYYSDYYDASLLNYLKKGETV